MRTLSAARGDAQQFASRLGLRVDEVMRFEHNFYAKLVDSHGHGATEVLVDPAASSGSSAPTPTTPSASAAVSLSGAHPLAQRWLDSNEPGVKVEAGGDAFPGYFTLETFKSGRITG